MLTLTESIHGSKNIVSFTIVWVLRFNWSKGFTYEVSNLSRTSFWLVRLLALPMLNGYVAMVTCDVISDQTGRTECYLQLESFLCRAETQNYSLVQRWFKPSSNKIMFTDSARNFGVNRFRILWREAGQRNKDECKPQISYFLSFWTSMLFLLERGCLDYLLHSICKWYFLLL